MQLELFKRAVMESRDGITIAEVVPGGCPLVFVNPAFERMTGYVLEEIAHLDCRYLQNEDRDQPAVQVIRKAIADGEHCLVTLRNYRKDGSLFWNELSLSPIFDDWGKVTSYIGIQKDVTARVLLEQRLRSSHRSLVDQTKELAVLATTDGLTGVHNRRFFDTQLEIMWKIARRNAATLALVLVDIDHFKAFNERYGHPAGDEALTTVAQSLKVAFTRSSDFVARYGGGEFAVLSTGLSVEQARLFAMGLCERVRALKIPHAGAPSGHLTISAGYAVHGFAGNQPPALLVKSAHRALFLAKAQGRNRCVSGTMSSAALIGW